MALKDKNKRHQYWMEWSRKNRAKVLATQKRWRERNPEVVKNTRLKTRYGITLEERKLLEEKQNNLCAICFQEKKLVTDHCHQTGNVRGLLCYQCNYVLGHLKEDILILESAIKYLKNNG